MSDTDSDDPSVPTELLEIHLECEDNGITPDRFKEVFGNETGDES